MNIHFEKSLLMSGDDYKLTPYLTLRNPTIREMRTINNGYESEQLYWNYVHFILSDPYSNMVFLDDIGKDFTKTSSFEVFMLHWNDSILEALQFFTREKHPFVKSQYDDGSLCLVSLDNTDCQINEEVYKYIYEWVKALNKIDYSDRINPADENARRILIEDARDKIKKQQRRQKTDTDSMDYIGNLMSAVAFGGNGTITPFNLADCPIYWLFEAFSIENKKSNASHLLDGLYHGTLSSKDINKQDLDWTK